MKLDDTRTTPIETSLVMMDALHDRWVRLLQSIAPDDFARKLNHPENGIMNLDQLLALYAWHGDHHVGAHHESARAQRVDVTQAHARIRPPCCAVSVL